MNILTPLQVDLLRKFAESSLNQIFHLTGGTALSAFFLKHRFSEDLDFFTGEPEQVLQVIPVLGAIAGQIGVRIEIRRQFRTFLEVFLHSEKGEIIKCDFAQDSPYRLEPVVLQEPFGIYSDSSLDIACNKLSALFDRGSSKDFVDIFFIDRELFPFSEILKNARKKHVGIDDYWLAVALLKVEQLDPLPRMVKSVDVDELKSFFLRQSRLLMQ